MKTFLNTPRGRLRAVHGQIAALLLLALACGCSDGSLDSQVKDIFRQDTTGTNSAQNGSSRRHPADSNEVLWTILMTDHLSICTGHLISPDLMMTASHCLPRVGATYTSGFALAHTQRNDLTVTDIVENSSDLDYAILRISWANGYPKEQNFPPLIATRAADIKRSPQPDQGDALFTVGFPADELPSQGGWGPTYSEGQAKELCQSTDSGMTCSSSLPEATANYLGFNVSLINGNSGGGVWRKSDHMLVSLSNNGPNEFSTDKTDWKDGDANDPKHWNDGPGMWAIYAQSATLRDVFPNGRNRFTQTNGAGTDSQTIWMVIGEGAFDAADAYTLYASAPESTTQLYYCETSSPALCNDQASGFTVAAAVKTVNGEKIFKGGRSTVLTRGLYVSVVAKDNQGNIVATQTMQFQNH